MTKKNRNEIHSMSKIERAFYMSVLSFSGDEQKGSIRRPLKCKNKPKILSAKNLFHIQFSFLRQGILDRACPGPLAAACLIYSMLKKEKNVTENKKKL